MKLEEISKKAPDGIYVGAKFDKETCLAIKKLCQTIKVPNRVTSEKLHTTIIFSRKYVPDIELEEDMYPLTTKVKGFKIFDTQDKKRALVLELDCSELVDRHNEIMAEYGTTYDHPEYIPHITISYDCGEFEPLSYGGLFPEITIKEEYKEDLVLDWQNKKPEKKIHEQYRTP